MLGIVRRRRPETTPAATPPDPVSDRSDTPRQNPGFRRGPAPGQATVAPGPAAWEIAWKAYRERGLIEDVRVALIPLGYGVETARLLVHVGLVADGLPALSSKLEAEGRAAIRTEAKLRNVAERTTPRQAQTLLEERAVALEEAKRRDAAIRGDATTQHAEEAKLARANRIAVGAMVSATGTMLLGVGKLATRISKQLGDETLTLDKGMRALKDVAIIVQRLAEASRSAVQTEHLVLGKPTAIIGTDDGTPKEMSPADAELYVDLVVRAAQRRAARATVIDIEPVSDRSDTHPEPDDMSDDVDLVAE